MSECLPLPPRNWAGGDGFSQGRSDKPGIVCVCLFVWRVGEEVAEARMEMGNWFALLVALAKTGDIPGRWRCELQVLSWKSPTSCSYEGKAQQHKLQGSQKI